MEFEATELVAQRRRVAQGGGDICREPAQSLRRVRSMMAEAEDHPLHCSHMDLSIKQLNLKNNL